MIRLEGVTRSFPRPGGGPLHAVREVDLEIARGECVALIGSSGCGKTTTLRLINRLLEPTSGRVLLDGTDVSTMDPVALRRRMGYVIQSGGLFPHMTVAENVGLLCTLEKRPPAETRARVEDLLARVHLPPERFGRRFPSELSGGQRQRVGVARALALDPEVLLMDEPFGALDPITRTDLQDEFAALNAETKKTVVLVSHDLDEAFRLADRVVLLAEGRIVQAGTLEDFRSAPRTEHVRKFLEKHLHAS